ncbi:MAG TPA: sensor domain-containing protein [Luteimonas sp.]|nr:sensor domain-containing protein [Luteimonas sp.]
MTRMPTTIPEYLDQLRVALAGADPALIQDALYDAEEYLRSEMAENPGKSEAEVIASVAGSYGAPEEVAEIYRDTEVTVNKALRPPPPQRRKSLLGQFFGVIADPRAYAALFYMLLSLATGVFYFTWVVTGLSLSLGLSVLIIGLVVPIVFFGTVRVLALVEGRIVEVMLGERMPRRPLYADRERPLLQRIGAMFTDPRTWSTLLYMLLMLPLGVAYFTIAVTGIATSIALVAAPVILVLSSFGVVDGDFYIGGDTVLPPALMLPLAAVLGVLLPFVLLHIARGIARLQGALAKSLLVKSAA